MPTHVRRNSSPHVVSSGIVRSTTPPRKISQPARLFSNNNESSSDEELSDAAAVSRRMRRSTECAAQLSVLLPSATHSATASSSSSCSQEDSENTHVLSNEQLIYHQVISRCSDLATAVATITAEAQDMCHAETSSMFFIDPETHEFVTELQAVDGSAVEVRLPAGSGVVGRCFSTKSIINIKNVDRCPFFCSNVDQLTGFRTRSILCFPILDRAGCVLAVVELCNRVAGGGGRVHFSRHDLLAASTFSAYAATAISHCLLRWRVRETERRSHMAAELTIQGSQLRISPSEIRRLSSSPLPPTSKFHPAFGHFHFVPRSIGGADTYVEASLAIFNELGFINHFGINRRQLAAFVLRVADGYRNVPYHNWSHAFAVAHFAYLLCRTPIVRKHLTELERLSLLIACLCHDIDHRGTTNSFQRTARTPLSMLYSSEGSVLERHHFQQTMAILAQPECDILSCLNDSQHREAIGHVREIILATDIAMHMQKVAEMREMMKAGIDFTSAHHQYLFTCLLMTASDLSDQTKHFNNSKCIAESIYREFFTQGDLERQMGLTNVAEMMDRTRACVPRVQMHFIDSVALPVFDMLSSAVPESLPSFLSLLANRRCWSTLDDVFRERGVDVRGVDYLHDESLEDEVMERVNKTRKHARYDIEQTLLTLDWQPLALSKLDGL